MSCATASPANEELEQLPRRRWHQGLPKDIATRFPGQTGRHRLASEPEPKIPGRLRVVPAAFETTQRYSLPMSQSVVDGVV